MTAEGFDGDYHFMIVEITGDDLYFQAISRTGLTIDSGVVHRPGAPAAVASTAPSPRRSRGGAPRLAVGHLHTHAAAPVRSSRAHRGETPWTTTHLRPPRCGASSDRSSGGALPDRDRCGRPRRAARGKERGRKGREEDGQGPGDRGPGRGRPRGASAFPGCGGGVRRPPRQAARQARDPGIARHAEGARPRHGGEPRRRPGREASSSRRSSPSSGGSSRSSSRDQTTLDARKAVVDGNPGLDEDSVPIVVRVNAVYPLDAPRSTVPPSLLLTLPPCPRASTTGSSAGTSSWSTPWPNSIVDILPAAAPDLAVK